MDLVTIVIAQLSINV